MKVAVRLFASYREAAGRGHLELELPADATVRDVIARVRDLYPLLRNGREIVCARNRDYVSLDERLAEGDEVALIPPVSGGAQTEGRRRAESLPGAPSRVAEPSTDVAVVATPLSVDLAVQRVRHEDFGGLCVFVGQVRRWNRERRVTHLEYEAYPEMAEQKMAEIARAAQERFGPLRIAIHHRIGDLAVGDDAVIIAVSAPHRDKAFAACRFAIDTLKEVVPIWKKEHTDDGAVWIDRHA